MSETNSSRDGGRQPENLSGKRYGRWTAVTYNGKGRWLCKCDCGKEKVVNCSNLRSGASASCGCLHREIMKARATHGGSSRCNRTPEYRVWSGMINRCTNKNERCYANYGARGIKVCRRWRKFSNFIADMGQRPSPKHTLERLDNSGHYEPGNCVWATYQQQANNRRNNHILEHDGRKQTIAQWAREAGISYSMLFLRIKNGWSVGRAITTPKKSRKAS